MRPSSLTATRPARLRKQTGGLAYGSPILAQSVTSAAALCRTKFSFGNLALTMIGVWLEA
jgi:hypothetical protein